MTLVVVTMEVTRANMEWICGAFAPQPPGDLAGPSNLSYAPLDDGGGGVPNATLDPATATVDVAVEVPDSGWQFHDWSQNVFIPGLCCFGIIGNLLNLVILTKRIREGLVF